MPTSVNDLIRSRPQPMCVKMTDTVGKAIELMAESDYSQLPVIDHDNYPKGLVTADSILKGLSHFGVTVKDLLVKDIVEKHRTVRIDSSVFDLLDVLSNQPAVLITGSDDRLVSIITNADAAEYFRRSSEDMMLLEYIETALQDHIEAAFTNQETSRLDEEELQQAIDEVYNAEKVSGIKEGVKRYLTYLEGEKSSIDPRVMEQLLPHLMTTGRTLADLSLNQLIKLMIHRKRWPLYGKNFSVTDKELQTFLGDINKIRNTVAHFKDELTSADRKKLRWCAEWFQRNPPVFPEIPEKK